MVRKMKRSRTEYESGGPSEDEIPVEETTPPRRSSNEAQRCSTKKNKNKGKGRKTLVKLTDEISEMRKLIENLIQSSNNQGKGRKTLVKLMDEISEMRKLIENLIQSSNNHTKMLEKLIKNLIQSNNNQTKMLEKLIESHTYQSRSLEKLNESHTYQSRTLEKLNESQNDLRKQLELHTNSPRSQWNQEQPRYRLVFKSNMTETIEKGQTIEIHVALVDVNNGQTVTNGPLASATVELVVIDAKFNQNDNQYNWSTEDFMSSIKKARQGNSATVNVDQSGKSIVSNGQFNLENGDKRHHNFTIFSNSSNKKVRLGVMLVSPTQERVLEGLSNPFFVRGHDRNRNRVDKGNQEQNGPTSNMQNPSCRNSIQADGNVQAPVDNGNQEQNEPTSNMQNPSCPNSTQADGNGQGRVDNGNREQNLPMSNMQNPSCSNLTQANGNGCGITTHVTLRQHQFPFRRTTDVSPEPATCQHQDPYRSTMAEALNNRLGLNISSTQPSSSFVQQEHQDSTLQCPILWDKDSIIEFLNSIPGTPDHQIVNPVRLILDTPSVVPSKYYCNRLDQLILLHSWQPKFYNCGLPTAHLMQKHFGSLTTMPKEVMRTRRERGVLIEPLEPDDSNEGRPLKRKLHSKYQLRFVNKVCETYYTWDQIKADEGKLLKVALFDENNTQITSGPLSSASVELVALHGDFNCDGQDYWTSEDFSRSIVCPLLGEEGSSVLGGDSILVLAGGEACVGDSFFQRTSFCARTGKFKMGVMLASAQEEMVQEGISEPIEVMDNRFPGECGRVFGKWPEEDSASINQTLVVQAPMWHLLSMVKMKASSYLLDQYKVMEGLEKQQKNLERLLPEILDIIEDIEKKGAFHDVAAAWISGLKKVACEANGIFDEFKHEALRREAKKKGHHNMLSMEVLRDRNPIVFRYRMGKKLCKIVQTIEVLITEVNALGFRHIQQEPPSKQLIKMESILFDSDMDIVRRSRDKEKSEIMRMLLHEASSMDLVVLPIFGMCGIGKTTLAKNVYNDSAIEKHFELRRWCCVSQDFDATNIANKICQTSVNDQDQEKALKDLQSIISGKRYLIVLDDIWNMDETKWGKLMTCLKHGGKGSVVLATTHHAEMARIMKMGAAEAYNIEKLSHKHLKEIFLGRAFSLQKPNCDELDDIVDKIVDRCAGCPLAAKTLGSLLSTKTSLEEWKAISDNVNWNNENSGILTSLYLSYADLPLHMKQCFRYCALFPKGYLIDEESLVQQWMALGFIPVQEDDNPENVGEEIFKELTWRSFFEKVKQTSPIEYGKRLQLRNGTMYKIHDLFYDLAQYVAGEECFTIVDKSDTKKLLPNTIQHLFMSRGGTSQLDDFSKKKFLTLRTLFCTDNAFSLHISEYTSLRVLHLPHLEHLRVEVSRLRNVRYLSLSGSQGLKELPNDIVRLSDLQTLDISNCTNLLQLPKDMMHMANLRHIYTNGCKSLMQMPPRLGKLTSLRILTYFVVGAGSGCSTIRELENLNLGGELELNCLQNATEELAKAASLENKAKLTHLSLRWNSEAQEEQVQHCPEKVLNALKPHGGLEMLRIVGYKGSCLPSWMRGLIQLQHLTEFHLLGLVSCEEFPQLCQLKVLRILYLEKLDKLQSLCSHVVSTPFPELKELRLHDLESLEKWVATEGKEEQLVFPVLEKIVIKNCPKLASLPEAPKLRHIDLDAGKSLLVKLRHMSSLSTLVRLIEAPRLIR